MQIIKDFNELKTVLTQVRKSGKTIGYVPTMGYLHNGHKSLMEKAVTENDFTVVSIFVNPIQFGPSEDLATYPRDLQADAKLCQAVGVDIIFHPEPTDMYQNQKMYIEIEDLSNHLCGAKRPGHFRGVCTVLMKFFNLIQPTKAYFGQKDAQQVAIVKKMVKDFNLPLTIVPCPIVREADGLALSSRNFYLSAKEREAALCLSRSLKIAQAQITEHMSAQALILLITQELNKEPAANIDYVSVVDLNTMEPVDNLSQDTLVAIAVYIGKTRLIDNFIFYAKGE